ncbi:hypothetical protein BT69DRAFT_207002 [Atractiella rhizophila]|nr:hypothetical protein BT69DRAFT_207002 [Atractiella rhizophila]
MPRRKASKQSHGLLPNPSDGVNKGEQPHALASAAPPDLLSQQLLPPNSATDNFYNPLEVLARACNDQERVPVVLPGDTVLPLDEAMRKPTRVKLILPPRKTIERKAKTKSMRDLEAREIEARCNVRPIEELVEAELDPLAAARASVVTARAPKERDLSQLRREGCESEVGVLMAEKHIRPYVKPVNRGRGRGRGRAGQVRRGRGRGRGGSSGSARLEHQTNGAALTAVDGAEDIAAAEPKTPGNTTPIPASPSTDKTPTIKPDIVLRALSFTLPELEISLLASSFWSLPSKNDAFRRLSQAFLLLDSVRAKTAEGTSMLAVSKEEKETVNAALTFLRKWGYDVAEASRKGGGVSKHQSETSSNISNGLDSVSGPLGANAALLQVSLESSTSTAINKVTHGRQLINVDELRPREKYIMPKRHYHTRGRGLNLAEEPDAERTTMTDLVMIQITQA